MFNKIYIILVAALSFSNFGAFAQKTTIWLVRHAEKSIIDPSERDPDLTDIGNARATALAQLLKHEKIKTVYSTIYKRTLNTVKPLCSLRRIKPVVYGTKDLSAFAAMVLKDNKRTSALIAGHSNTIIPVIKALNCEVPFEDLADNDYDMLFKAVIDDKGKAKLTISHYGDLHHSTEVPVAFSQGENPETNTPLKANK